MISGPMILSGTDLATELTARLTDDCAAFAREQGRAPALHVLLIGENPASLVYVSMKKKRAEQVGILAHIHHFPADVTEAAVSAKLMELNHDVAVDGILVQLPLPGHINAQTILNKINPVKDVDGLSAHNLGLLMQGQSYLAPCTPMGCMQLIQKWHLGIASANFDALDLSGLKAVVVGRSTLVGTPLSILLTKANATVTLCHSKTKDLASITRTADIVVAACGCPGLITAQHIKPGACVIDVGISRCADGTLKGDVDFDSVFPIAGAITPVPGGVGPMTVFNLLSNTVKAAKGRNSI